MQTSIDGVDMPWTDKLLNEFLRLMDSPSAPSGEVGHANYCRRTREFVYSTRYPDNDVYVVRASDIWDMEG